jgi:hypothetical protein
LYLRDLARAAENRSTFGHSNQERARTFDAGTRRVTKLAVRRTSSCLTRHELGRTSGKCSDGSVTDQLFGRSQGAADSGTKNVSYVLSGGALLGFQRDVVRSLECELCGELAVTFDSCVIHRRAHEMIAIGLCSTAAVIAWIQTLVRTRSLLSAFGCSRSRTRGSRSARTGTVHPRRN